MSLFSTISSEQSVYWLFFLTGISVGFGHCIGMCGPIAVSVSLSTGGKKQLLPHFFYSSGRIFTYSLLGGIMGFFGSFTRFAITIVMIQKVVLLLTGALITFMGLVMAGIVPPMRIFSDDGGSGGMIGKGFKYLSNQTSSFAFLPIGMLLGFLPCGPIYAALVAAARMGMDAATPVSGALTGAVALFCFGLGTAPALLLVGKLAGVGVFKWRRQVYKIGGFLMIGMGLYFMKRVIF